MASSHPHPDSDHDSLQNGQSGIVPTLLQPALLNDDEDENRENRPDGVDDNPLPLHDRGHLTAGFDETQKRCDNCRPRHDQNGSEERADLPVITEAHPRCDRGEAKGDDNRDGTQSKDRRSGFL